MFCKNCGKETEENAKYCTYCGTALNNNKDTQSENYNNLDTFKTENNTLNNNKELTQKESHLKGFLIAFIVLVIFLGIILTIAYFAYYNNSSHGGNNENSKPFSRSATNNDIYITTDNDFSLSINCTIKPNVDINNLQLKFTFADKNQNMITTKLKTVGNVLKNIDYKITFSLSEFNFTELLSIALYKVNVTNGTVSY